MINPQEQEAMKLHFYQFPYGARDGYLSTTENLTIYVRSIHSNWNYTVTITDRNKSLVLEQTYFVNQPNVEDTHSYNLIGMPKPVLLQIKAEGNQIFSDYLGSPFDK